MPSALELRARLGAASSAPQPIGPGGRFESRIEHIAPRTRRETIAFATGRPVARSQRRVVSRWFVIPMAATSRAATPARSRAWRAVLSWVSQISTGSCSTQPGLG